MLNLERLGQSHHGTNYKQGLGSCNFVHFEPQVFDIVFCGKLRQVNAVKGCFQGFRLFIGEAPTLQGLKQAMCIFDQGCHRSNMIPVL